MEETVKEKQVKAQELRIGSWITYFDQFGSYQDKVRSLSEDTCQLYNHGAHFVYGGLMGIKLSEEWLLKFGFETLPHFTITNSMIKHIGRNRIISVGNVGTANEMIWLCEINKTDPTKIDDLVCLRNFDYDGLTPVHVLQNLCYAIEGKELSPPYKTIK